MEKMPLVFVGHGSPMNAIEDNRFTQGWESIALRIPRPTAIVCISAHWYEKRHSTSETPHPATIHDFFGFPDELYEIQYNAPGAPDLAKRIAQNMNPEAAPDAGRGLDHGAWSVLRTMYPKADIPVCQLSVNALLSPKESYLAGSRLRFLRESGVLVLGSGNIVHNLAVMDWNMPNGYPWADEFDAFIRGAILAGRHEQVFDFNKHPSSGLAFYTRDHFDPLLYVLGAAEPQEPVAVLNGECVFGSVSMTSYIIG